MILEKVSDKEKYKYSYLIGEVLCEKVREKITDVWLVLDVLKVQNQNSFVIKRFCLKSKLENRAECINKVMFMDDALKDISSNGHSRYALLSKCKFE